MIFTFLLVHSLEKQNSLFNSLPSNSKLSRLNATINFASLKFVHPSDQFSFSKTNFFSHLTFANFKVSKSTQSFIISAKSIEVKNAVFSRFLCTAAKLNSHDYSDNTFSTRQQILENSVFTNCIFNSISAQAEIGGAVYANDHDLTFTSCRFNSCSSRGGGAIYTGSSSSNPSLTITDCSFNGNNAEISGSSIYAYRLSNITITGTSFEDGIDRHNYIFLYDCISTSFSTCDFISQNTSMNYHYISLTRHIPEYTSIQRYTMTVDLCCFSSSSIATLVRDSTSAQSEYSLTAIFTRCSCYSPYSENSLLPVNGSSFVNSDPKSWFGVTYCYYVDPPVDPSAPSGADPDSSNGNTGGSEGSESGSANSGENVDTGTPGNDGGDDRTGMIVGIVIACVVVVAGCIAALIYFFKCRDTRTAFTPGEPDDNNDYNFNMDAEGNKDL